MKAAITDSVVAADGVTHVSFEIRDGKDKLLAVHSQGFAPERERVPEKRTRTVPKRAKGSGDVVRDADNQPVMVEETYDELVETGKVIPASAETIREGIANYGRDVVPLRSADPAVAPGETFNIAAG